MSTKNMITVSKVKNLRPCVAYTDEILEELIGKGITATQVLKKRIPYCDKAWVLARFMPKTKMKAMNKKYGFVSCDKKGCSICFESNIADHKKITEVAKAIDGSDV